jgi:hypothetical protein
MQVDELTLDALTEAELDCRYRFYNVNDRAAYQCQKFSTEY